MTNSVIGNERHEIARRGRKPVNGKAMTPAERQARRRKRFKDNEPKPGTEAAFRLELFRWMNEKIEVWYNGKLNNLQVIAALEDYASTLRWYASDDHYYAALNDYLDGHDKFSLRELERRLKCQRGAAG